MGALTACHGGTQPLLSAAWSLQKASNNSRQAFPIDAKQQLASAELRSAATSNRLPHGKHERRFLSGDLGAGSFLPRLHGLVDAGEEGLHNNITL